MQNRRFRGFKFWFRWYVRFKKIEISFNYRRSFLTKRLLFLLLIFRIEGIPCNTFHIIFYVRVVVLINDVKSRYIWETQNCRNKYKSTIYRGISVMSIKLMRTRLIFNDVFLRNLVPLEENFFHNSDLIHIIKLRDWRY